MKLNEAIDTLRETCFTYTHCKDCPLFEVDEDKCGLSVEPWRWDLVDEEDI